MNREFLFSFSGFSRGAKICLQKVEIILKGVGIVLFYKSIFFVKKCKILISNIYSDLTSARAACLKLETCFGVTLQLSPLEKFNYFDYTRKDKNIHKPG